MGMRDCGVAGRIYKVRAWSEVLSRGRQLPSSGLFLTVEEVREEVARSRVACFVSQSEDGTLLGDEYAERFEDSGG